ncbi:Apoptosis-inducing factor [Mycena indigotica]|uniref:Apoptosis-inducing factor n=1 Tax=Mycena indigotica TaxID=2126181 RepID=A0A8H6S092_9AGAR|nr:Apoptosis-inducing factor [Mycena indigotica]KAF7289860.1 Apoptosis-inducing factor [Mycena indigotica]
MSAKKNDDRKSIVILGGGAAGINTARPLSAKLDASKYALTLIDPRPFRVLLPATLRMVVSDKYNLASTESALVPYDKLFHGGKGTFIQDSVQSITQQIGESSGFLTLASGQTVPYDILVLATGLAWSYPIAFPDSLGDVQEYVKSRQDEFAGAENYLLVGGGAIGCELAGELKDIWPAKDVTIVHGQRLLLNDSYSERYRRRVANDLAKRGVNLQLNELVPIDNITADSVTTQNGLKIAAGLVVKTTGASGPNTAYIQSLGSGVLTPAGFVKVQPTLQLLDFPNVFAAGDIVEWPEQKQAIKAQDHAALVAKNVLLFVNSKQLKNYKTAFEAIVLTNGRASGSSYFGVLWGIIIGGWLTALIKSKNLLIPRFRSDSGLA